MKNTKSYKKRKKNTRYKYNKKYRQNFIDLSSEDESDSSDMYKPDIEYCGFCRDVILNTILFLILLSGIIYAYRHFFNQDNMYAVDIERTRNLISELRETEKLNFQRETDGGDKKEVYSSDPNTFTDWFSKYFNTAITTEKYDMYVELMLQYL
eukprot:UN27500